VARITQMASAHVEVDDMYLIALAKQGDMTAYDRIVRRYYGFVRLKASSYFLAGGDGEDLIQEGLVGLYKAVRDYRSDRESSFRNFAELCITRQIITAIKTATRQKHVPLNGYLSFSQSPSDSSDDGDCSLADVLPGPTTHDPVNQVISSEEVDSLTSCLTSMLSDLEGKVLRLYLQGLSYERIAGRLGCDCKTVDNALQRIKRKVDLHLEGRRVPT
jgi:RNA polymerase sporulation-specific sigma factor